MVSLSAVGSERGITYRALAANQEIEMAVTLSFREEGPSYDRAKAVADAMGVSLQDYLLACIAEGAKVLKVRHLPAATDYEEPTFIR